MGMFVWTDMACLARIFVNVVRASSERSGLEFCLLFTMGLCESRPPEPRSRSQFFFHEGSSLWWWHWDSQWWRWDPGAGAHLDLGFQEGCWVSPSGENWFGVDPDQWTHHRNMQDLRLDRKLFRLALLRRLPPLVVDEIASLRGED